eukprot:m.184292 g.184292  ORF g.184292 m.184292 type:complete len:88 (-) comp17484_c4_seq3:220-483(-)
MASTPNRSPRPSPGPVIRVHEPATPVSAAIAVHARTHAANHSAAATAMMMMMTDQSDGSNDDHTNNSHHHRHHHRALRLHLGVVRVV